MLNEGQRRLWESFLDDPQNLHEFHRANFGGMELSAYEQWRIHSLRKGFNLLKVRQHVDSAAVLTLLADFSAAMQLALRVDGTALDMIAPLQQDKDYLMALRGLSLGTQQYHGVHTAETWLTAAAEINREYELIGHNTFGLTRRIARPMSGNLLFKPYQRYPVFWDTHGVEALYPNKGVAFEILLHILLNLVEAEENAGIMIISTLESPCFPLPNGAMIPLANISSEELRNWCVGLKERGLIEAYAVKAYEGPPIRAKCTGASLAILKKKAR